jgi:hypothetical protein
MVGSTVHRMIYKGSHGRDYTHVVDAASSQEH